MANLLADAQNNLSNWENVYQKIRQNHERLLPETEEFSREGEDDENGEVNPAGVLINQDHARMNSALDAGLTSALRTFDGYLEVDPSSDRNTLLDELFAKMSADEANVQVKSRGTSYGAAAADGGNTGNATLYVCSKDVNDDVIESATIETLTFRALAASSNRQALGLEPFSVKGEGLSSRDEFTAGGRGTKIGGHTPIGPGRSNLLTNASFDLALSGSGTDKVQGWDFESGESNVARDTAEVAEDRGQTHASLKATGNFVIRFYFRKRNIGLSYLAPLIAGLRWRADGSNGDLNVTLGSTGATSYTVTQATSNQASFQQLALDPDDTNAWRKNFDANGNPYLEISVTSYVSGNIWFDDAFCDALDFIGGRWCRIVSGTTPTVEGDKFTQACTLDVGAGSVELTGGGSGSVDGITVDGVELMTGAVAYDTSLAVTAQAVVDDINSHRTFPNYIASLSTATVVITQEVPVEGTLTVVASTTTITTTDTDVTGASLGKKQDAIVRRSGKYLPHASSASSGWSDHA